ncbi:hypothetical protein DSO57_1035981 [Entomophthora muscae]|uniref:Uncharacterized protein n=1 Tax=Entomophthora muscae TaxID=34485 RepID=A0ACC2RQ99_9FUNG|nr:hypothetical protein DSO57_1035981 [Entomophthora muscae]
MSQAPKQVWLQVARLLDCGSQTRLVGTLLTVCGFFPGPFVILLWTTSPVLWSRISSLVHLVSNNPSSLLHLPSGLLFSGEALVKSLTCNNLDLYPLDSTSLAPLVEEISAPSPPPLEDEVLVPLLIVKVLAHVPSRAPWLLTGLALMGLNIYFPQMSPVSSLWSPFRVAFLVIHWMASWWFVSPGWEPNLVSPPFSQLYQVTLRLHQFISISLQGRIESKWQTGAAVIYFQSTVLFKSVKSVNLVKVFLAFLAFQLGKIIPSIMESTVKQTILMSMQLSLLTQVIKSELPGS